MTDVDLSLQDPGFEPVQPFPAGGSRTSFVTGDPESRAIRMRSYLKRSGEASREASGELRSRAWFGPAAEGPPGCAHGGSTAAALDEAMGTLAWSLGHQVVAARLEFDYRVPVRLEKVLTIEVRFESQDSKKLRLKARLMDRDRVLVEGQGVFVRIDPRRFSTTSIDS